LQFILVVSCRLIPRYGGLPIRIAASSPDAEIGNRDWATTAQEFLARNASLIYHEGFSFFYGFDLEPHYFLFQLHLITSQQSFFAVLFVICQYFNTRW
jgi:hypothetical protein